MKQLFIISTLVSLYISSLALAQQEERHIHVNGEHLDNTSIAVMDLLFGKKVTNGFYWINENTGQWGFEGETKVRGVLKIVQQIAQQNQSQQAQNNPTEINMSQNGRVVSGKLNGQNCTFVSVGGTTVKSCD
ncbi:MAG: hypothetical protein OQK51_25370 [Kangiellaceae bacterium]|nr:hypothetical protein [Kangiellaceae bacterium]